MNDQGFVLKYAFLIHVNNAADFNACVGSLPLPAAGIPIVMLIAENRCEAFVAALAQLTGWEGRGKQVTMESKHDLVPSKLELFAEACGFARWKVGQSLTIAM
ncbi:hypothetical protein KIL84_011740 [Mauremys mutica]|uniref:Uncharacterized protein n=1 Tax=Mauremys mutica TaxID=74926 RepID=A0A9D3XDV2_9SAUR|nr:hypothetical protein KIL84_011740 [Mauremys mutica]